MGIMMSSIALALALALFELCWRAGLRGGAARLGKHELKAADWHAAWEAARRCVS
jgi:hypothetical protein